MRCKKPYNPTVISDVTNYLVVDGVINTGADSTIIALSRTVNLSSGTTTNPETNAVITVESDANASYPLKELKNGHYASVGLNLDNTRKYRLRINTSNQQQYLSDFVTVKVTPPIDSIGYKILSTGLQLYANTHDPQNNTRYYRWDFNETWQFHAQYASLYVTNGKAIVPRPQGQDVYYCFGNDKSSSIVLGSSAKLEQDVIYQQSLTTIPSSAEKIETKYSILVQQYALTSDAFAFWTNLKKNTEQLGSIFDAQPSSVSGNIHNANDPSEPVIGYVSASTIQTKRIFISNSQLPQDWRPAYPYDCSVDTNLFCRGSSCQNDVKLFLIPLGSPQIPIEAVGSPLTIGYLGATAGCADCTVRGTKQQPAFWK